MNVSSSPQQFTVLEPIPTPTPNQTTPTIPVSPSGIRAGDIAGIASGIFLALLIFALALFIVWKKGYLSSPSYEIAEPDYPKIAFGFLPMAIIPSAFTRKNSSAWTLLEEVPVSHPFPFSFRFIYLCFFFSQQMILNQDKALLNLLSRDKLVSKEGLYGLYFLYAQAHRGPELLAHFITQDLAANKAALSEKGYSGVFTPSTYSSQAYGLLVRQVGLPYLFWTFQSFLAHLDLSNQNEQGGTTGGKSRLINLVLPIKTPSKTCLNLTI